MSLLAKLKGFVTGEVTTFQARRSAEPEEGKPHPPILVTVGDLTLSIDAGDFSRALGPGGERVKATVMAAESHPPKRAV